MATLAENIARNNTFHADLRDLITEKGGTIPAETPCEDLIDILDDMIPDPIFGVSGLYQESTSLTRTDDAVGLSFAINSSSGTISSDFNNVFPWNKTEIINDEAGKLLKFPDMYFRVGFDNSKRLTDVAVSRKPSGSGNWYKVDSFAVSCYKGYVENNKLKSLSGKTHSTGTRAQFREWASNNGADYLAYDLYHRTVLLFLWWIEFATKKGGDIMTGTIVGSGTSGSTNKVDSGGTDSVVTPSGFETSRGQMRWHGIEDFIGNSIDYVDGACTNSEGSPYYVTADPAEFNDSTSEPGGSALSYNAPSVGVIMAIGWDVNHPFLCLPIETASGISNCYFCDKFVSGGLNVYSIVLTCGTYYCDVSYSSVTWYNRTGASETNKIYGSRLLKYT